jgi:peptidyl-prolyl cis-trans isomerase SurA
MNIRNIVFTFLFAIFFFPSLFSQQHVIDQVVGVVGNLMLKQSDIEIEYNDYKRNGYAEEGDLRCLLFENHMQQKLLTNQAMVDSLPLSESQVESSLNDRLNNTVAQVGSIEKLESLFGKSYSVIKEDLRKSIREMMLAQSMQSKVLSDIKITPTEVKSFYDKLPTDSLPMINSQVEIAQLALYPAYAERSVMEAKEKLLEWRKMILDGKQFAALAALYSEDDGTRSHGGEIGFQTKAELDPAYAASAFALSKPGEVSRIVESQFGFHIIQLIERKGDRVNTRHILVKPQPDPEAVTKVRYALDSIAMFLRKDSIKWDKAVLYYSMDENTRFNNGYVVNPQTGGTKIELENLAPADFAQVKSMKVGDISDPYESRDKNGKTFYKIITIRSTTPAHKANLKDDYYMLQEAAKNQKKMSILEEWFVEKQQTTFIRVLGTFRDCSFKSKGWVHDI